MDIALTQSITMRVSTKSLGRTPSGLNFAAVAVGSFVWANRAYWLTYKNVTVLGENWKRTFGGNKIDIRFTNHYIAVTILSLCFTKSRKKTFRCLPARKSDDVFCVLRYSVWTTSVVISVTLSICLDLYDRSGVTFCWQYLIPRDFPFTLSTFSIVPEFLSSV